MADLSKIQQTVRTIRVPLPDGSGKFSGLEIDTHSIEDKKMQQRKRLITDRRTQLAQRGKEFTAVQLEENEYNILFDAMTGWRWLEDDDGDQATFNGEIPDFTRDNVIAVIKESPWIGKFVAREISDDESFFKASKGT